MYRLFLSICWLVFAPIAFADGDANRGEALTGTCVACHGTDGNSLVGSFPNIAGQNASYLYKQLVEIQSGWSPPNDHRVKNDNSRGVVLQITIESD